MSIVCDTLSIISNKGDRSNRHMHFFNIMMKIQNIEYRTYFSIKYTLCQILQY